MTDNKKEPRNEGAEKLSDVQCVVRYQADNIRIVGDDLALRTPGNLWVIYSNASRRCRRLLARIIRTARAAHSPEAATSDTSEAVINSLVNQLHDHGFDGDFQRILRQRFDLAPIIPFNDGSHLHLANREERTCRCDLQDTPMLDWGWDVPPPDWNIEKTPDIVKHFGTDVMHELAQRLWPPDKTCDFLINPHSNSGKSTLTTALAQMAPGLIYRMDASYLRVDRMAFSAHLNPLTSSRIAFYDEAARAGVKWTDVLYAMTDDDIDLNLKHRNETRLRRIGTPIFLGADQPNIDSTSQGNRVGAVWFPHTEADSVDADRRKLWLSEQEIDRLRVWMLRCALLGPRDNNNLADMAARERFVEDAVPESVIAAQDALAHLKPAEAYTLDRIKGILEAAAVEIGTRDRDLGQLIRAAYPKAVNKPIREAGGKRKRLWTGIGANQEPPARTEPRNENPKTTINKPDTEASDSVNKIDPRSPENAVAPEPTDRPYLP